MREIRLYGLEGGGAERLFLPLFHGFGYSNIGTAISALTSSKAEGSEIPR